MGAGGRFRSGKQWGLLNVTHPPTMWVRAFFLHPTRSIPKGSRRSKAKSAQECFGADLNTRVSYRSGNAVEPAPQLETTLTPELRHLSQSNTNNAAVSIATPRTFRTVGFMTGIFLNPDYSTGAIGRSVLEAS
jgi:hypothetical protein